MLQLCKQVERAAAITLASIGESDALLGASVASVEPAGRLTVIVVLAAGKGVDDITEAKAVLRRSTAVLREEVARSIHRKRVPEVVFDVRLAEEVTHGRDV